MSSLKQCLEPKHNISKYNVNRLRKCAVVKWKKNSSGRRRRKGSKCLWEKRSVQVDDHSIHNFDLKCVAIHTPEGLKTWRWRLLGQQDLGHSPASTSATTSPSCVWFHHHSFAIHRKNVIEHFSHSCQCWNETVLRYKVQQIRCKVIWNSGQSSEYQKLDEKLIFPDSC